MSSASSEFIDTVSALELPYAKGAHERLPPNAGHTIEQAGGSPFLSTPLFLIFRLINIAALTLFLVLYTATSDLIYVSFSAWTFIVVWLSFLLATFSSLRHLIAPHNSRMSSGARSFTLLAKATVATRLIALGSASAADLLFWTLFRQQLRRPKFHDFVINAANFVLPLVDTALSARMLFRPVALIPVFAFSAIWLAFSWLRYLVTRQWLYFALDFRLGVKRAVLAQTGVLLLPVAFAAVMLIVNKLTAPRSHLDSEDASPQQNQEQEQTPKLSAKSHSSRSTEEDEIDYSNLPAELNTVIASHTLSHVSRAQGLHIPPPSNVIDIKSSQDP